MIPPPPAPYAPAPTKRLRPCRGGGSSRSLLFEHKTPAEVADAIAGRDAVALAQCRGDGCDELRVLGVADAPVAEDHVRLLAVQRRVLQQLPQ